MARTSHARLLKVLVAHAGLVLLAVPGSGRPRRLALRVHPGRDDVDGLLNGGVLIKIARFQQDGVGRAR